MGGGSAWNCGGVEGRAVAGGAVKGTSVPGIARKASGELAGGGGFTGEGRDVSSDGGMDADEWFWNGTAVVVAPVGSVTYKGKTVKFCDGKVGPTSQAMYDELTGIQQGKLPDERGWNVKVPKFPISG